MKDKRLQEAWDKRRELKAECDKFYAKSDKLNDEANKLWVKGNKHRAEGSKLWAEGDRLWAEAVLKVYGNVPMKWEAGKCILGNEVWE